MLTLQIKCKNLVRWHCCRTCCTFGVGVLGVWGVFRTNACTYHRKGKKCVAPLPLWTVGGIGEGKRGNQ